MIDTTIAGCKLVFDIFGKLAEFDRGIIRALTRPSLDDAATRGPESGLSPKLLAYDLKAAKARLSDPTITVDAVARRLDVSPAARSLAQVKG